MRTTSKVLHPELSYAIIGAAFSVYNTLQFGHKEIVYQRAFAEELNLAKLEFEREARFKVLYRKRTMGVYVADFIIANKIVVELKVRSKIGYVHIRQVATYLRATNYELAILIYFTKDGVKYRRVLQPA